MPDYRYLIVGGGMTGDAAARGIRDHDPDGTIGLIGEPAHGVFQLLPASDASRLDLYRLSHELDPELAQVLTAGRTLEVPAADEARFLAGFAPGLQRTFGLRTSEPTIARCNMTGTLRELPSATYSAPSKPGMEKSTCMVPHCQERPMLSFRWYSILGP